MKNLSKKLLSLFKNIIFPLDEIKNAYINDGTTISDEGNNEATQQTVDTSEEILISFEDISANEKIEELLSENHHDLFLCKQIIELMMKCKQQEQAHLIEVFLTKFKEKPRNLKNPKQTEEMECIATAKLISLSNQYFSLLDIFICTLIRKQLPFEENLILISQFLFINIFDSIEAKAYALYRIEKLFNEYRIALPFIFQNI